MKAPSVSNGVSRETMIENIKEEYSSFEDIDFSLISDLEESKDIFSKPLGVDRKKEKLDMLFSDVSSGIKKGFSNNHDDKKERSKDKKKKSFFGFLSSFFSSFFSLLVKFKELVFLLVLLLLLLLSTRKPSKKKNN